MIRSHTYRAALPPDTRATAPRRLRILPPLLIMLAAALWAAAFALLLGWRLW